MEKRESHKLRLTVSILYQTGPPPDTLPPIMKVERIKYVIWAADMNRAVGFYTRVFDGAVLKQNEVISEIAGTYPRFAAQVLAHQFR